MTLMVISPQADVSMDSTALDLVREMSGGCNAQVNPKLNGSLENHTASRLNNKLGKSTKVIPEPVRPHDPLLA
jgi:hypothetical protein